MKQSYNDARNVSTEKENGKRLESLVTEAERFTLRAVTGGLQTIPADAGRYPLLARLHGYRYDERKPPEVTEMIEESAPTQAQALAAMRRRILKIADSHDVVASVVAETATEILFELRDARAVELEGALALDEALAKAGYPLQASLLADGRVVTPATPRGQFVVQLDTRSNSGTPLARVEAALQAFRQAFPAPSSTYCSLAQFLAARGYESAWAFGRALYKYTDCGPWVAFITPGLGERGQVYYESKQAAEEDAAWWGQCVGLRIGSIVEGSDVEIGPHELLWPFTEEQLDKAVEDIDEEAAFYWKRDNTTYYTIGRGDQELARCSWTEFEDEPEVGENESDEDDTQIQALAKQAGDFLFEHTPQDYETRQEVPGLGIWVREDACPDMTY